jgi:hypothetical protein
LSCPGKGCDRRTLTCHGVCRKYEEWKIERAAIKDWIREKNMLEVSDTVIRKYWKNIKYRRRRGTKTGKEG